ncbi:MAG: hypothetical protein FJZ56_02675 [Chlamydiae bacterium]|nr:hypothetical protein [Chlamydiota bacterium]
MLLFATFFFFSLMNRLIFLKGKYYSFCTDLFFSFELFLFSIFFKSYFPYHHTLFACITSAALILLAIDGYFYSTKKQRLTFSLAKKILSLDISLLMLLISSIPLYLLIDKLFLRFSVSSELLLISFISCILLLISSLMLKAHPYNFYYRMQKALLRKKRSIHKVENPFVFSQEIHTFIDKEFPLLRKTSSFLGKKEVSFQLKVKERPHIFCLATNHFQFENFNAIYFPNTYTPSSSIEQTIAAILFGSMIPLDLQLQKNAFNHLALVSICDVLEPYGYQKAAVCSRKELVFLFKKAGFSHIFSSKKEALEWLKNQIKPTLFCMLDNKVDKIEDLLMHPCIEDSLFFVYENPNDQNDLKIEHHKTPLWIYSKDRYKSEKIIKSPASLIDILPTIIDLLQLEALHHCMGNSLVRKQESRDLYFFNSRMGSDFALLRDIVQYVRYDREDESYEEYTQIENKKTELALLPGELDPWRKPAVSINKFLDFLIKKEKFFPAETRSLDFSNDISIDGKKMIKILKKHPTLYHLNISHCFHIQDKHLYNLSSSLRSISLQNLAITDHIIERIVQMCPQLEKLDISGCLLLTNRSIQAIGTYGKNINYLAISDLRSESVDLLKGCTSLKSIVIK